MSITRPLATVSLICAAALAWAAAPVASSRDVPRAGAETSATAAADAAMAGDAAALRSVVKGGGNVNAPQGDGMTALHWAAEHSDAAAVALLLKAGADPRATTRIGQHTPLHVAAKSG
ncbi:MAG: ankyrin repeat domain-containing protein, partial [Acidobacteria bacterium]|nr:ankyrin repeat domain-containing protein [Acidobacteriota bacterium]